MSMDHVWENFVSYLERAQCVTRDLGSCCCNCRNRSAGKTNFSQRRGNDCFNTRNLLGSVTVDLRDARMSVRAAQDACIKHSGQTLIVGVTRNTGRFQWAIYTCVAVIKQRVLVVWSPTWSSICVDFDLDHLLDAVHNARDA